MRKAVSTMFATLLLSAAASAVGKTDIRVILTCTLNDGKTMDDVAAANGRWVKYQNKVNEDAGIRSWGAESIIGATGFVYIDWFPSLEVWSAAREASTGPTPAAIANAIFDAVGVRARDIPFTPARLREAAGRG